MLLPTDTWEIWACLLASAATGYHLNKTPIGGALSGPVCAMLSGALLANMGVLPPPGPHFTAIQTGVVSLATPLLLLGADLRVVFTRTRRLVGAFGLGSLATVLGAVVAFAALESTTQCMTELGSSNGDGWKVAAALAAISSGHLEPIAQIAGDVFAETGLGPALCVAGTVWVGWIVWSGTRTIKALKEELTGMGYDVDEFNRIGELKAIKRAVEDGTVDSIFDKVWYSRAAMAAGSGSIVDVQKVQAYWKGKGITVKTLADLDKVTAYMIKKYGKDAKMGMM